MPQQMDLSDRDYFRVHKDNPAAGVLCRRGGAVARHQRAGQPRFFALSRRRIGPNGEFAGVTTISISPDYFTDYYATLPQPLVAALVRDDGMVLARYPGAAARRQRGSAGRSLMRAVRARPRTAAS